MRLIASRPSGILGTLICVAVFTIVANTGPSARAENLITPGTPIIAIDATGETVRSSSPGSGNENAPFAVDQNGGTKYLNFGHVGSGLIVTPVLGSSTVQSFQIRTANDAPGRDPASWELFGTNEVVDIGAVNHTAGLQNAWTLIGSGIVNLPGTVAGNDGRNELGPLVDVTNAAGAFTSYKVRFPTLKDLANANSMQLADIQLFTDDAGTTGILAAGDPTAATHIGLESRYPAGERPLELVDGITAAASKYLNFGEENSGVILTLPLGATVNNMILTTANDAEARDPASYELYGTNDPITSAEHSTGTMENWTLISSGALSLPSGAGSRNVTAPPVAINAGASYSSYKLLFPTVRDSVGANSMQISELQFDGVFIPEPSTWALMAMGGLATVVVARRRRK